MDTSDCRRADARSDEESGFNSTCDTSEGSQKDTSVPRTTLWADIASEDESDDFWLPASKDKTAELVEGKSDYEWAVVADKKRKKKKSHLQATAVQPTPSHVAKMKEPSRATTRGDRQASLPSSQTTGKGQAKLRDEKKFAHPCQLSDKQVNGGRPADQGVAHRAKPEARSSGNTKDRKASSSQGEEMQGAVQKTRGPPRDRRSTREHYRQQRRLESGSAEDWMAKRLAAV